MPEYFNIRVGFNYFHFFKMNQMQLPKLPKRQLFQLATQTQITCAVCSKTLKGESEFCLNVRVCRTCLGHHAKVEARLNEAAERKSLEIKRLKFIEKL